MKRFNLFFVLIMMFSFALPSIVKADGSPSVYQINYYECKSTSYVSENYSNPNFYTKATAGATLKNPTKEGYTFDGWYSDKKCSTKVTKITGTGDKTYYAKFTPIKFTVKFNANGGKGTMGKKTLKYGSNTKLPKNTFKKSGMTFVGWSLDKKETIYYECGDQSACTYLTTKANSTVTLYAVWGYKLTLKTNYTPKKGTWLYDEYTKYMPKSYTNKYDTYLPQLERDDNKYIFMGWYSDSKFKKPVYKIAKGTKGNKTYYAKWEKIDKKSKAQAIRYAKYYINSYNSSKKNLQNALMNAGYTESVAKHAVSKCGANYTKEAKDYIRSYVEDSIYGYSKNYLKRALKEYNQFTEKETNAALDYAKKTFKIDYKKEALKRAKDIVNWSNSSKKGLKSYLIDSYLFTKAEAEYAIKNIKVDYKKNAVNEAKYYARYQFNSKEDVKSYLKNEGFTTDEINNALSKINWTNQAIKYVLYDAYSYPRSYNDLYTTLTQSEKYSASDAKTALSKVNLDYNANAKVRAKEIENQNKNYYSRPLLKNRLINDYRFTAAQAEYGVANCGVNWTTRHINLAKNEFNNYAKTIGQYTESLLVAKMQSRYSLTETDAKSAVKSTGINFNTYYVSYVQNYVEYAKKCWGDKYYALSDIPNWSKKVLKYELTNRWSWSEEEAEYAVSNAGIDYSQRALNIAKEYWADSSSDGEYIIGRLTNDFGFTQEEAEYALEHYMES